LTPNEFKVLELELLLILTNDQLKKIDASFIDNRLFRCRESQLKELNERAKAGVVKRRAAWLLHFRSTAQQQAEFSNPAEVQKSPVNARYPEGATQRVSKNAFERNSKARQTCISHYGPRCVICGFDFGAFYGDAFQGHTHVHHLRDLATIGKEYEVDPVQDLRPVCPNCHSMLHTERPAMSIDTLREIVKERRGT